MHSLSKGYAVFENLIDVNQIRSTTSKPMYATYDTLLKRCFAARGRFRPTYTVDHYFLLKRKEDSLMNKHLPSQTDPTREDIVRIVSKKKPKKSMLQMAQELKERLDNNSTLKTPRGEKLDDILRESVSKGVHNLWMNAPDEVLPVYKEILAEVQAKTKIEFPTNFRLAGDKLLQKDAFLQADGYACTLSELPYHLPWKQLVNEIDASSEDCKSWSSLVLWIFHTPVHAGQGGIHFIQNSHRRICAQAEEKNLETGKVTSHAFAPMRGHVRLNIDRFGMENHKIDSYMSFGAGTVVLMHPATAYCMPVNMTTSPVASQQLFLMRDGVQGPVSPHTDESWYGRYCGAKAAQPLQDSDIFPFVQIESKT